MAKNRNAGQAGGAAGTTGTTAKGKGGRPPVDPNETKASRFIRIAPQRVSLALKRLDSVGHLAGSNYEYTPAQIDKIKSALSDKLKAVLARFDPTASKAGGEGFTL